MKFALKPLAAGMAALFGASSLNVWGAPPAPPPAQNQNSSGPQTGITAPAAPVMAAPPVRVASTLLPAQPPEFTGIAWGSFLVFPDVSLAVTYDDNIYAERTNVTSDLIYTLSPSIELKSNWARHALNFDLGGDFDRYQDNDSENVNDYWLGLDGRYDLGPQTNIFGGARYSRDHEDRSAASSAVSQAQVEPTRYDHDEAHLGIAHKFGAFNLRAGGTWDRYDYKDGSLPGGVGVDNDYRDHELSSLGMRLGYALSPEYEVFGQYASDTRQYDNLLNLQTFNRDSDGYRAAAGLKFTLQPQRLAGEIFAGVMRQDYDYSGFSSLSEPYFGALAVWKPSSLTTVTGFVDRSLEETNVFTVVPTRYASGTLDTTYGFEISRRLTSRLSANASAAYTTSDFQDFDRSDTIIDAGAGLRYYVNPTVYLAADLRITDRDSSDLDGQYSRNQFMVSVGYTPARSRDYSIIPEREAGAPEAPPPQGLYSGFYAGAQLGYGGVTTKTFGPRDGGGYDSADMGGFGASYGLFAGWGTEMDNWYLGVEIDGSDSDAGWYHRKGKDDSRTMYVDKDAGYGASVRVGYQLDGGLLVGSLGVVNTDFRTYYTENLYATTGAFDQKHSETGTRFGLGLEIPASPNLFVRADYRVTRYDGYDVLYQSGIDTTTTETFETEDAVFSVGLGWRFGNERPGVATRSATELRGLYAGASLGHSVVATELTGTHYDGGVGPYDFAGDFANSGFSGGFFAGYGYTFDQVYVGLELDAEASTFGWYHERETGGGGGRDFAVEKQGSYGGSVRVGYALANGGLLYGRVGTVQTRFNTIYRKGAGSGSWIDRSDDLGGTRYGLGAEIPASDTSFVRMDYSYTRYGDSVSFVTTHGGGTNPDAMNFENSETLVRLGLGFRF